jgi:hypothetical protein
MLDQDPFQINTDPKHWKVGICLTLIDNE